jgi:hypothetical protein
MLRHLPCSPAPPLAPTTAQAHDARCWLTTPARSAAPRRGSGTLVQTESPDVCRAAVAPAVRTCFHLQEPRLPSRRPAQLAALRLPAQWKGILAQEAR